MTLEEAIIQLKDLKKDRESFVTGDKEHDEVFLEDIQAIEVALQELERLTEARNWYFEHTVNKAVIPEMLHKILSYDYISVDVIKEKIEELKDMNVDGEVFTTAVNFAIKVLEEILQEKEDK